jgi:hypothetical protein
MIGNLISTSRNDYTAGGITIQEKKTAQGREPCACSKLIEACPVLLYSRVFIIQSREAFA